MIRLNSWSLVISPPVVLGICGRGSISQSHKSHLVVLGVNARASTQPIGLPLPPGVSPPFRRAAPHDSIRRATGQNAAT